MPGEPDEVYQDHGLTVEQWVSGKTPDYKRGDKQPVSCSINGAVVKPSAWADTAIGERDNVEFRVVPYGTGLAAVGAWLATNWLYVASAAAFIGGIYYGSTISIPGQQGQGAKGSNLDPAAAKANTARLGQGVPEVLGKYIRYPDYLNQPRMFYQDKRTQVLRLFLSVSVGSVQVNASDVKVGETPFSDIAGATFQLFEPGADVSGSENHENWFQSTEVGATTGSAGIRLKGITLDQRSYIGSATGSGVQLSGVTVGEFWTIGTEGTITLTQSISVTDGGPSGADIFSGDFQNLLSGMSVNVDSSINVNGTYVVSTINGAKDEITLEAPGGTKVINATLGPASMSIDKTGTKYKLTAITGSVIDVERILSGGGADTDWSAIPSGSLTLDIEWEAETFTALKSGPFVVCPEGETTDEIEVDIFASQGLGVVDGENINNRSRTIKIEWREVGDTVWTEQEETVSGGTRDQLGFTFTVALGSSVRPEVRVS